MAVVLGSNRWEPARRRRRQFGIPDPGNEPIGLVAAPIAQHKGRRNPGLTTLARTFTKRRDQMSEVSRLARFSGTLLILVGGCAALGSPPQSASPSPASREQITILYDAFGKPGPMQKDWGYAALVEYGGKRILFDTGK